MGFNKRVKRMAKNAMRKHYGETAVIVFIVVLFNISFFLLENGIYSILSMLGHINPADFNLFQPPMLMLCISLGCIVLRFFLLTPLYFGIISWFYAVCNSKKVKISDIFCYYVSLKSIRKTIVFKLIIGIRLLPVNIMPLIPVLSINYIINHMEDSELSALYFCILVCMLPILLFLLLIALLYNLKYLSYYVVYVRNSSAGVFELIGTASYMLKGKSGRTAGLYASYTGWFSLCVLIVPAFFVIPYFITGNTVYSIYLMEKYNEYSNIYNKNIYHTQVFEKSII